MIVYPVTGGMLIQLSSNLTERFYNEERTTCFLKVAKTRIRNLMLALIFVSISFDWYSIKSLTCTN